VSCCDRVLQEADLLLRQSLGSALSAVLDGSGSRAPFALALVAPGVSIPGVVIGPAKYWRIIRVLPGTLAIGAVIFMVAGDLISVAQQTAALSAIEGCLRLVGGIMDAMRDSDRGSCKECVRKSLWSQAQKITRVVGIVDPPGQDRVRTRVVTPLKVISSSSVGRPRRSPALPKKKSPKQKGLPKQGT